MLQTVSLPLQEGICLFRPLNDAPPSACLTVGLPGKVGPGGVTTFPRSA